MSTFIEIFITTFSTISIHWNDHTDIETNIENWNILNFIEITASNTELFLTLTIPRTSNGAVSHNERLFYGEKLELNAGFDQTW